MRLAIAYPVDGNRLGGGDESSSFTSPEKKTAFSLLWFVASWLGGGRDWECATPANITTANAQIR